MKAYRFGQDTMKRVALIKPTRFSALKQIGELRLNTANLIWGEG